MNGEVKTPLNIERLAWALARIMADGATVESVVIKSNGIKSAAPDAGTSETARTKINDTVIVSRERTKINGYQENTYHN